MPLGVVTLIKPVVAPAGTVTSICVDVTTVYVPAFTPLTETVIAPVKVVPVTAIEEPITPLPGEKPEICGVTEKFEALVPVPDGVVTAIAPVVAPTGTLVVIWKFETTVNVALVPLKVTVVAPVNASPLIVTEAPSMPFPGEKLEILGVTV